MNKTRCLKLCAISAFVLSLLYLKGCITISSSGESSAVMKDKITGSEFYRVSTLFFPDREVGNPQEIPLLTEKDLHFLQHNLENTLHRVLKLHKAHHKLLTAYFGHIEKEPEVTVLLTNLNLPEAQTVASGEIAIDVRVLQSALRSALLTAYEIEIQLHRVRTDAPFLNPVISSEEEAIAINTFLSKRERFEQTPGPTHWGELTGTRHLGPSSAGALDWFELRKAVKEFNRIEVRYHIQELFLLAHELGHIVLGHFTSNPFLVTDKKNDPQTDDCSTRRALERAADIYAGILITQATSPNAIDDFLGLAGGTKISDGFETFFRYAYNYAGFQSADGSMSCINYPPPPQRLATIRGFYDLIRDKQVDAIINNMDKGS